MNRYYITNKNKYVQLSGGVIRVDKLKFEIIRLPHDQKHFEELQQILTNIALTSSPESFDEHEKYYPLSFTQPLLNNVVIIIGYIADNTPVVFMTLTDKKEMEINKSIGKSELIKRGALDNDMSAWYLADIYGLHQKYKGIGYLSIKFFEDTLLKEKDYVFTNTHLYPFYGWNNVGELELVIERSNKKYYNYRKMSA